MFPDTIHQQWVYVYYYMLNNNQVSWKFSLFLLWKCVFLHVFAICFFVQPCKQHFCDPLKSKTSPLTHLVYPNTCIKHNCWTHLCASRCMRQVWDLKSLSYSNILWTIETWSLFHYSNISEQFDCSYKLRYRKIHFSRCIIV